MTYKMNCIILDYHWADFIYGDMLLMIELTALLPSALYCVDSLWPRDVIWHQTFCQHWFRYWLHTCFKPSNTWNNVAILTTGQLGINFSDIGIKIQIFSFKEIHVKMLSAKCQPFCSGLNLLNLISCLGVVFWVQTPDWLIICWIFDVKHW